MKLTITFEMDNAAFYDDDCQNAAQGQEAARILRSLADLIEDTPDMDGFSRRLHDANGNVVGVARSSESP